MEKNQTQWIRIAAVVSVIACLLIIGAGFACNSSASSDETYKSLKIFSAVIEQLEKDYVDPVDTKQLIEAAIQGMVKSLDPHSEYLPPDAFKEFQTDTKGEFEGIGIVITMPKGLLTVISPIEGTPAFKSGILPGDIIIAIDGESTMDMELWEAVKRMRGEKGTTVNLTIRREGVAEEMSFDLVRAVIPIVSVKYTMLKPGYGYVWVTNFQGNTTDDVKKALAELEADNKGTLKGLIFDLRNNPGGLLDQAVAISDLFLDEGTILSIKERKDENTYSAHPDKVRHDYPMVLLINGGSASASEILAGALQDHKRALVIGTTSFGKGSVQTVQPLNDGSGIKYTIARYYTPNGTSIQNRGIIPDIEVKFALMEEPADKEPRTIKEKDLKNHLEAAPKNGAPAKNEKKKDAGTEKKEDLSQVRYGSLDVDLLMRDSQVVRALDALISYEIFSARKAE
ncbi:MAG: S41 family peptidase [Thermodesulfobacteriota bacterium]